VKLNTCLRVCARLFHMAYPGEVREQSVAQGLEPIDHLQFVEAVDQLLQTVVAILALVEDGQLLEVNLKVAGPVQSL
jgi:hypothetical protein